MTFAEEVSSLVPFLRERARRFCRRPEEAEDLVQDVLLLALQAEEQFDPISLRGWLYTIMRNRSINLRRKEVVRRLQEGVVSCSASGVWRGQRPLPPDAPAESEEAARAVSSMSPVYLDVLEKVGLLDWKYREYAESEGCPIGTVMSRLNRARAAAAEALS